jgi:hypothetical protein
MKEKKCGTGAANAIDLSSYVIYAHCSKLEYLTFLNLDTLAYYFAVKLLACYMSGAALVSKNYDLHIKIGLDWKLLSRFKHTSLLYRSGYYTWNFFY